MTDEQFVMTCVYVLTGILGLCVGSFLNVVIYRVPLGMSLSKPSSHCPRCGYSLSWFDNVPLFSYLFLGGKSAHFSEVRARRDLQRLALASLRFPFLGEKHCLFHSLHAQFVNFDLHFLY